MGRGIGWESGCVVVGQLLCSTSTTTPMLLVAANIAVTMQQVPDPGLGCGLLQLVLPSTNFVHLVFLKAELGGANGYRYKELTAVVSCCLRRSGLFLNAAWSTKLHVDLLAEA